MSGLLRPGSSLVLCASPVASSPSCSLTPAEGGAASSAPVAQAVVQEHGFNQAPHSRLDGCQDIMLTNMLSHKFSSRYSTANRTTLSELSREDGHHDGYDLEVPDDGNSSGCNSECSMADDEDDVYRHRRKPEASCPLDSISALGIDRRDFMAGKLCEDSKARHYHNVVFNDVKVEQEDKLSSNSDCERRGTPDESPVSSPDREHGHRNVLGPSLKFMKKFTSPAPLLQPVPISKRPVVSFSVDGGWSGGKRSSITQQVDVAKLKRNLSGPLPWTKEMEERIEVLGPHLDASQKILLWIGIVLDIITKISIMRELNRYAKTNEWPWFSMLLVFFIFSSTCVTIYWWTHYPVFSHERVDWRGDTKADAKVYGWSKSDVKRLIRNAGAVCAFCGLGTCFLAVKALFTSDKRQRAIAFDLRGMRLVDTIFLTLVLCLLQVYIGVMCTNPAVQCKGHPGFDTILLLSVLSSLSSASLCYTALDLNDLRIMYDCKHQIETTVFFLMRLMELGARTQLLAMFAALRPGYIFVVFVGHMLLVVVLLRFSPGAHQAKVWQKVSSSVCYKLGWFTFVIPKADDMKLLVACLVWPPSCFVSDATAKSGEFWWRARTAAKRPFWNITLSQALLPWPLWMLVMAGEAAGMYYAMRPMLRSQAWARQHLEVTVLLHLIWFLVAAIWAATVHMVAAASSKDTMNRALARKLIVEGHELTALAPRSSSTSSVATLTQVILNADSDDATPKLSSKRYHAAFPLGLSAPVMPTPTRDQQDSGRFMQQATNSAHSSPNASPPQAAKKQGMDQGLGSQLPPLELYEVPLGQLPPSVCTPQLDAAPSLSDRSRAHGNALASRPSPLSRASSVTCGASNMETGKVLVSLVLARPALEQNLQQLVHSRQMHLPE